MKTNFKLLRNGALLMGALMISTIASAQWSISANLGYLFDGWSESPQVLFKKGLNDGNSALRFSIGGEKYSNYQQQSYFDESYSNRNDLPSDVDEDYRNSNMNTTLIVAPGFEIRTVNTEKNVVYYGLDAMFRQYNYEYNYVSLSQNYNAVEEEFTISNVYSSGSTEKEMNIMPKVFLGFGRHIGHGLSILVETSIGADIHQNTYMSYNNSYNWNGTDFVNNSNPEDVDMEEMDASWMVDYNWLPRFDFWFTYTFGNNE
jgi:hypothetical protein